MRPVKATPRQAQVLDTLCELGETELVAAKLGLTKRSVQTYISRVMWESGYDSRIPLCLAWDRQRRSKIETETKTKTATCG